MSASKNKSTSRTLLAISPTHQSPLLAVPLSEQDSNIVILPPKGLWVY